MLNHVIRVAIGANPSQSNCSKKITVGGFDSSDASVELNGTPLSYESSSGQFRLPSGAPTTSVVTGSDNILRVQTSAADSLTLRFHMPGDFTVTAPAFSATLPSNTPFTVAFPLRVTPDSTHPTGTERNPD